MCGIEEACLGTQIVQLHFRIVSDTVRYNPKVRIKGWHTACVY